MPGVRRCVTGQFRIFQTKSAFDLSKLDALKTAGWIQSRTKNHEIGRAHGFEDVELGDAYFEDFPNAIKKAGGISDVLIGPCSEQTLDLINFVQS